MLDLILLCLVIAVPETDAKVTFFPQRNNGVPIFHRPSSQSDVYNGHAKPKDKLQITLIAPANVTASKEVTATSTSTIAPVTRPPEPPSNYFVTWRPEVTDSRQVIITVRTRPPSPSPLLSLANPEYRPQHFFSELAAAAAPASTLPPFLLETAVSLSAPRPGTRAPAATPAWQFTPVFNPIFSAVTSTTSTTTSPATAAKYGATFKFAKKTTTPRYSAYQEMITKSTTIASTTTTTRSTTTTTTTTTTLPTSSSSPHPFISKLSVNKTISGGESEQFPPPLYNYNYNAPVSAAVGLEDEDTIFKNPTTFIAYIRYLLATFLRLELI